LNFLLVGPLALAFLRLVWFEWGGRRHLVLSFLRGSAVLCVQRLRGEKFSWGLSFLLVGPLALAMLFFRVRRRGWKRISFVFSYLY